MTSAGVGQAPALCFDEPAAGAALAFTGVTFRYRPDAPPALDGLTLDLYPGEVVAVVGGNGSGKTTLARLANGLLVPLSGEVRVSGLLTSDEETLWEVRSRVGLLFQNPDDQIVGATVEDDVAFGLENLGVPPEQMRRRVVEVLDRVGLTGEERREPHLLSGGQKQRLALAAVLALQPSVLVLDEPTSMLDSGGREEILSFVRELAARGVAVLLVTQHMEETLLADRLAYLESGRLAFLGAPGEFFGSGRHRNTSLGPPPVLALAAELLGEGGSEQLAASLPLLEDELVAQLGGRSFRWPAVAAPRAEDPQVLGEPAVELRAVSVTYDRGLPFAREALADVDLVLPEGAVVGVVGPTAAGKSTLLQVIAGLMRPSAGSVRLFGRPRPQPGEVGMVFQRPEFQLFAASVADDVATAPRLQGLTGRVLEERVAWALEAVDLDPATFGPRPPHALSLGEQRRVALAGILSLAPRLLILDEPGAGLDPRARLHLVRRLVSWTRGTAEPRPDGTGEESRASAAGGRTLIFTSHDLEEVAEVADRVLLLAGGRLLAWGGPELLADDALLGSAGLRPPLAARVSSRLGAPHGRRPVRSGDLRRALHESGGER